MNRRDPNWLVRTVMTLCMVMLFAGNALALDAAAPASITVPDTDADGRFTISWGASTTKGVRYILQEATDEAFTTNLRVAFSGKKLSADIFRPEGQTYYYRVKAAKKDLTDSPWVVDEDGCAVGTQTGALISIDTLSLGANATDPTKAEVNFHVSYDATDAPVTGLNGYNFRFYFAALIPGASGSPDTWQQWNQERVSTSTYVVTGLPYAFGTLTDLGNGDYTYVFSMSSPTSGDLFTSVNRMTVYIGGSNSGGALPSSQIQRVAAFHTFNWNAMATALDPERYIVTTAACRECHSTTVGHNASPGDNTMICVNCHNGSYIIGFGTPEQSTMGEEKLDFTTMVHQIHSEIDNPLFADPESPEYDERHIWSNITYPQEIVNCAKCHKGPDGDNWRTKPSRLACGSCHTGVDFVTGEGHEAGAQTSDASCQFCHQATADGFVDSITKNHMTANNTPNNPDTPEGAVEITYHIFNVTVNENNEAVVVFAIKQDGVNMDLSAAPVGFTGSGPGFILAYALPQDGINPPADYNNLGMGSAQPASVSLSTLYGTANLVPKGTGGRYTATLAAAPFPAGATMRAVALQGYWTQAAGTNGIEAASARHTPSVVKAVAGDAVRRTVVDQAKCLKCHEILELHGGSRVNNPQVCVFCHNPNLASSGRTYDLTSYVGGTNSNTDLAITMFGADSTLWPEATNNFKDMIHGIHGGEQRTYPYEFVRVRSGNAYPFDWSEVTFPGDAADCTLCHKGTTYKLPLSSTNFLSSTNQVAVDGSSNADVTTARLGENLPGDANTIISPTAATCFACHNSDEAVAHMNDNAAAIKVSRLEGAGPEPCFTCHGPKKWMDVKLVHGL